MKQALGLALVLAGLCGFGCSGTSHSNSGQAQPGGAAGSGGAAGGAGSGGVGGASAGAAGAHGALGSACSLSSECASGVCSSSLCREVSCVPGNTFCAVGGVWKCGTDGVPSALTQHCSSDQFCLEKAGTATCSATSCFPADAMCVQNLATHCEPDGSGPKPGGTDCTQSKQVCYSGECRDLVCTPGQKLCDNNALYLCGDAGTSRALVTTCATGQTCDSVAGACQARVCEPGKLGCDSSRLVTCNGAGTGWTQSGTDCAAKMQVCVAGACQKTVCSPSQSFCQSNSVYRCSADGTTSSLTSTCSDGPCVMSSNYFAYCGGYSCTPSAVGCNGNILATCKADGSGWNPGGTDCSLTNAVCVDNGSGVPKCTPAVCPASSLFCSKGNVQQCDDQGLSFTQVQFCPIGSYCLAHGGSADCSPTPCTPDTDGCVAEKLGHCASDGMSVAVTSDCGAATQVCTLQGCAKSSTNLTSASTDIAAAFNLEALLNVVQVQSARKLTTIEAYLTLPDARTLVWLVYEQTNADGLGEFDLKFSKSLAASGAGTGFLSSGPISVELEAGKTYAIGVTATDGGLVYYLDYPDAPVPLNFGHVVGSTDQSYGAPFDYQSQLTGQNASIGFVYYDRLTTTAP